MSSRLIIRKKQAAQRLCAIGLLFFFISIGAQSQTIRLKASKATVKSLIEAIQQQTGMSVDYRQNTIDLNRTVKLNGKTLTLETLLKEIVQDADLQYTISNRHILITQKSKQTVRKQEQNTRSVTGTVTDDEGGPLAGALVRCRKANAIAVADASGKFTISLPEGTAELQASYLGMDPQTVIWNGEKSLNIIMTNSAINLDNVVITGYQEIDKRKLASSITTMKMDDLMTPSATSLDQMLQGRIAGMLVMNSSSTPGVAPKIRIRGSSSITGNREPVWVVDGIILDEPVAVSTEELNSIDNVNFVGNAISGINPSDIERIDILKDVSATAIYGVKAANGVIVVTTRKGRQGKPQVSYTGSMSMTTRPTYGDLNLMNSKERVELSEEMVRRGLQFNTYLPTSMAYEGELQKLWDKSIDYDTFRENVRTLKEQNTDWMKMLYRNALTHQHSVSVSGAGDRMDYYLSLGYLNQQGASRYEDLERITAMLKVNAQLTSTLSAGLKISANNSDADYPHSSVSVLDYAYRTSRAIPAYNADGSLFYYDNYKTEFASLPFNIFNELNNTGKDIKTRGTLINVHLDWKPLKWLKLSSLAGLSFSNTEQENWADEQSFYIAKYRLTPYGQQAADQERFRQTSVIPVGGELQRETSGNHRYTWRNSADFSYPIGDHLLFASVGTEINSLKYDGYKSTRFGYMPFRGKKFADIDITAYDAYAAAVQKNADVITDNTVNTLSAYGTFSYSYLNKYIANFNIRTDGSNRFGQDKSVRFLPVWSVSGRWNVGEEKFMKSQKWINELAFRASYGIQGNVHPSQTPNLIVRQENYNSTLGEFVSTLQQFPNKNLRWEKTVSYNFGIDFSILDSRISGVLDLYRKRGYDQIVNRTIAPSNGATSVTINEGDIENKGWELSLNVIPILTKDWTWSLSVNTSKNYNKVIEEGNNEATWQDYVNGTLVRNGRAVNSLYSYRFKGLDHNTGLPTFYGESEQDADGKTVINSLQEAFDAAFVYSGKREPDLSGGFSSSLKYKHFTLNALFSFNIGNKIRLNDLYEESGQALPFPQQNMSGEFINRWQNPGDEAFTNIPVLSDEDLRFLSYERKYVIAENRWDMYNKSDIRVVSGSFLRCRSASLRYDFESSVLKALHIKGGSITLEGSNLFVIKSGKLKGKDPEQLSLSSGTIPPQQTYTCRISLTF